MNRYALILMRWAAASTYSGPDVGISRPEDRAAESHDERAWADTPKESSYPPATLHLNESTN